MAAREASVSASLLCYGCCRLLPFLDLRPGFSPNTFLACTWASLFPAEAMSFLCLIVSQRGWVMLRFSSFVVDIVIYSSYNSSEVQNRSELRISVIRKGGSQMPGEKGTKILKEIGAIPKKTVTLQESAPTPPPPPPKKDGS